MRSLSVGKGIDGVISKSQAVQVAFKDQLSGERDVVKDLRDIVGALGNSSGEIQNLSVASLMSKIAADGSDVQKSALQNLISTFRPLNGNAQ